MQYKQPLTITDKATCEKQKGGLHKHWRFNILNFSVLYYIHKDENLYKILHI